MTSLSNAATLMQHEVEALLAALRRDMRAEEDAAAADPQWADWHRNNARLDKRLLETLNPKREALHRTTQILEAAAAATAAATEPLLRPPIKAAA